MIPLDQLSKKYATVVIDPPWKLGLINFSKNGYADSLPYPTMTVEALGQIPIKEALAETGWVFCWTTNKMLKNALSLVDTWGLDYCFTMTWVKQAGPQAPNTPCFNSEWIVVSLKGTPKFLETKHFKLANIWKRERHSEKPEGFYDLLRRVSPAPRLDIYGRRRIAGFDSWGNEAPDLPALPDHYQKPMF